MSQNHLVQTFKHFLNQEALLDKKILLMISGGIDSMVLLHVASQCLEPKQMVVFHLDHQLRPESKEDATFVQNICSKIKVDCVVEKLESSSDKNQEAHWRKARTELSQAAAKIHKADRILTAHHAGDLVETMIFRLTKGCGPSGLSPFLTNTKPLWTVSKEDILAYAQTYKLEWREDSTNTDTYFQRNLIRKKVIPVLRTITPNLEKVFIKESILFEQVADFIETECQKQCGDALANQAIDFKDFLALHPLMQKELLRHIAQKPISQAEVNDALDWLLNEPQGQSQKPMGARLLHLDRQVLRWNQSS